MKQIKSKSNKLQLTRRSFMISTISGSLVMGFGGLLPSTSARAELSARKFSPAVWFEMDQNGTTLINIAKAEMGQHVGTALGRIVAEELGVNWSDVKIKHVDTDAKWGYMITGGSWSVFTSFTALSQAGAAGRSVLLNEGARLLGEAAGDCVTGNSLVSCGSKSISYARIVQTGNIDRVFTADELAAMPVKAAKDRQLLGKPTPALDIPEKSTGTARYGIDAGIEGMVYARPLIPPTRYGSVVKSVDDAAAKQVSGYLGYEIISDPSDLIQGWVSVLATTQWGAIKAADAVTVDWQAGPTASVSEDDILAEGERLVLQDDSGALFVNEGDFSQAADSAQQQLDALYRTSSALHFTLEPMNSVAEFRDGQWHIHTGNQWQSLILPFLATALEVPEDQIVIHQYYLGGGFGRRLFGDYIVPAVLTAKALGKPVKMVFTRPDDSRFDCLRSPSVSRFRACLDDNGQLTGIDHAAAAGWPTLTMAPGFIAPGVDGTGQVDGFSINGADHWYTIPNHRVRAINNDLAQKTFLPGWLRAVGPGWITWGTESFMDEVAHSTGRDPIEFRLALLDGAGKNAGTAPNSVGGAKRLAHVLQQVKSQSGWGKALAENEGMGVATGFGQERNMPTWIACVARVKVDPDRGKIIVTDLYYSIYCGTVIDPDGALAQAESAALWGVSLALHENTRINNGQVADTNLDSYTPLRMADMPELHIDFVESGEFPVGLGEPPLSVVAPAIGNAIYSATGVRLRDLPMSGNSIKTAL